MATYGLNLYNSGFRYGEASPSSVYYNANLQAQSSDYGTVTLTWTNIVAPPTDSSASSWMLVKSYKGVVDNPYDGITIAGGPIAGFTTSYVDVNYTNVDLEASYSIWIFNTHGNTLGWVFCGSAYAMIVGDKDTLTAVSRWIPRAWTNNADNVGDAVGERDSNTFTTVLSTLCFTYDLFRTEAAILAKAYNHAFTPSAILKAKMGDYLFEYEPALGDTYHRSLSSAGFLVQKYKGTPAGLTIYTGALTHLTSKVSVGTNLMLDYNDSSFEESVGRWTTTLGTLTQQLYSAATATYGITLLPPKPWITDPLFTPRNAGFGALVITGATTPVAANLILPSTSSAANIINYAIPVSPGVRYVFSGWVRHLGTATAAVTATISWYDQYGTLISTTAAGSTTNTSSSAWSEVTSKSDGGRNGQLSPAKALYAVVDVNVLPTTTATTTVFVDMFQLAKYQDSLEFEDARRIRLYLKGQRENLLSNPSFENGVSGWLASPNASFAQDPTVYNTALFDGYSLGELTVQSGTGAWVSSQWFPVTPGQNYTFSAYVSSEYPTAGRAYLLIEYSNRETTALQTQILSDSNGKYYSPTIYSAQSSYATLTATQRLDGNGNPIVDTAVPQYSQGTGPGTYNGYPIQYVPVQQRLSVSAIAPDKQTDSGQPLAKVSLIFPDMTGNGLTVWMDGLMFENSPSVGAYFSGSGAPTPSDPVNNYFVSSNDTVWETKTLINYIQNPSFESNTNTWTATTGTTLTQDAGPAPAATRLSNPDGTYQNPPSGIVTTTYLPAYGSYMGKVSYPAVTITAISSTGSAVTYRYSSTSQVFAVGQSVAIWGNMVGATPKYNNTTPTGWSASAITAVATVTAGSVYSFTVAGTDTGTATTFGQAQINGASISTTVYLSSPAVGGEDFVVHAQVRAAEGTYTIGTSGNGLTTSNSMEVYQHDQYQWIRIWNIRQLVAGETSFTFTVSIALPPQFYPTGGPGYTIATTSYFHIDGIQAEYGNTPNGFLYPYTDSAGNYYPVTSMANPGNPSTSMWVGQMPSIYGGKSSYFNNYAVKLSRLTNTLGNIMPPGVSWTIKPGYPTDPTPELTTSLIPSASFEASLGTWSGTSATLARTVSRGSLFGDNVSHGTAYCTVTSTASTAYGITSAHIPVTPAQGYYASVAVRPTTASVGTYTLTVNFYDANGTLIPSTGGSRSVTATITQTNRWAYLGNTFSSATTLNASYAVYTVTCTPTTPSTSQSFGVDRCVFRQ
jgi:hypothetical protein